ncbi:MAG TPA: hypothetical protein VM032_13815 [Vicinamibacterales bacterium]|nr:hypothetical protein [Vicinamibacterales bacterium]
MMFRRLLIAAATLLATTPAAAVADGLSFNATLGSIRLEGKPGDVFTRQFQLTLGPDQPRASFKAHFEDWWRSEDGRQSIYAAPGTLRRSCATWTTVNPVESTVAASETLVVRFTVAIPTEVAPGGFWCALTLDQLPDPVSAPAGVGVQFVASVSTAVFIDVGPIDRDAIVTALSVEGEHVSIRVRNTGNTPVPVEGRVEFIQPGTSAPRAVLSIPRGTLLTEPSREAAFGGPLPSAEALPSGRYTVRALLDIETDHYLGAEQEVVLVRNGAN